MDAPMLAAGFGRHDRRTKGSRGAAAIPTRGAAAIPTRGAAAVEFALVAPLVLFLFFAIIEAGFAFYGREAISLGVSDAARTGSVARDAADADVQIIRSLDRALDRATGTGVDRIVVYEASSLTDPPPAGCIAGTPSAGCNVYPGSVLDNPAGAVCSGWCPADREPDDLVGVWVGAKYRSLSRVVPLQMATVDWAVVAIEPEIVE